MLRHSLFFVRTGCFGHLSETKCQAIPTPDMEEEALLLSLFTKGNDSYVNKSFAA